MNKTKNTPALSLRLRYATHDDFKLAEHGWCHQVDALDSDEDALVVILDSNENDLEDILDIIVQITDLMTKPELFDPADNVTPVAFEIVRAI